MASTRRYRRIGYGVTAVAIGIVLVELASRGYLAVASLSSDPFQNRAGTRLNASLLAELQGDLDAREARRELYVADANLFWKLAPNRRLVVENSFWVLQDAEPLTWDIHTDSLGCRSEEPPPDFDGIRILTLGDSCTFGHRVPQADVYPSRLGAALRTRLGGETAVHVRNAGVPGYTSHQGRKRLRSLLEREGVDLVTIAFGANDLELERLSDAERSRRTGALTTRSATWLGRTGFGRLLLSLNPDPPSEPPSDEGDRVPRVSDPAYRDNVLAMIRQARAAGARVILLDLVFLGPRYESLLTSIAQAENVPRIDGRAVLEDAWRAIRRGEGYHEEAAVWMRFYEDHVQNFRPIYYGEEFYARRYADPEAQNRFILLMADPIHPNAVGHRALADALADAAARVLGSSH